MVNYISILVFVILLLVGGAVVAPLSTINPVLAVLVGIVWLVADAIIASAIQLAVSGKEPSSSDWASSSASEARDCSS